MHHAIPSVMLLIFALPVIVVGGLFLVWALKIITGNPARHRDEASADETRLIQELHRGLARMEERIEAIETLLLDPDRKDDTTCGDA